ncbi:2-oxoadipate dehydrogenase complex component E1 isoform X2 [Rhodnius prolixus]|uniref:2-oxoadipate dehydrogenase complex component E1 isoform X2 n=1 Tax=Rhodnius prolixus TaxID=13249 RepID=UPI003D18AEFB
MYTQFRSSVCNSRRFWKNFKYVWRDYQWHTGAYGHRTVVKQSQYTSNLKLTKENSQIYELINAYRQHGHKRSQINPVIFEIDSQDIPELSLERYSLSKNDKYNVNGLLANDNLAIASAEQIVEHLENIYCNKIAVEFSHLEELEEREWFHENFENISKNYNLTDEYKKEILKELLRSQVFDRFLATKFVTLKRYGCEGAEGQIAFFLELFRGLARDGVGKVVISAQHRGRLNILTGLLSMPPELIFRKVHGKSEFPEGSPYLGDVISHLCHYCKLDLDGHNLMVSMTKPPSHLEASHPVSVGQTRAWQQEFKDGFYGDKHLPGEYVVNVQIHGDAAIMGQGVSQETILMSHLPHFTIGGAIHLIVNNQLGFTTPTHCSRGTRYCSDIAKVIAAPVIHVNGDYPEEIVRATKIAVEYQRRFRKSAFIDLNCYRRWGHNEMDDPTYTNPLLYKVIREKSTVPDLYAESLKTKGIITAEEINKLETDYSSVLSQKLLQIEHLKPTESEWPYDGWKNYKSCETAVTEWDTGVNVQLLKEIGINSVRFPSHFTIHPNLKKAHINARIERLNKNAAIDWSTAEALAVGSLLYQGFNARISGQDVGRGTFSHRHFMIIDQSSNDVYVPLNHLSPEQVGKLEVANSLLSEEAVLGFEYGFSSVSPYNLVIWEAQFGDFFNGAQIQIDTYISSGEAKWGLSTGIVMLLPHGYDGAGPEHSSARLERFLQLSDSNETKPDSDMVNMYVVNPTTPAQYFHLLRRQMIRNFRKPLVVIAPKILLRLPDAVSSLNDMEMGTSFQPVIGDNVEASSSIRRIIFVSGKHYYALRNHRDEINAQDTVIIRLEELSPFPVHQLRMEIAKYKNVKGESLSGARRSPGIWELGATASLALKILWVVRFATVGVKRAGRQLWVSESCTKLKPPM